MKNLGVNSNAFWGILRRFKALENRVWVLTREGRLSGVRGAKTIHKPWQTTPFGTWLSVGFSGYPSNGTFLAESWLENINVNVL